MYSLTLSHLVAVTVLFAKNVAAEELLFFLFPSRKHQRTSTTLTQILLRKNPHSRPSITLRYLPSTKRSFVTSPSPHLSYWRASERLHIDPPVIVHLSHSCQCLWLCLRQFSALCTALCRHSPETGGCKAKWVQPSTCSIRTGLAPVEPLSTPVIPEKMASH